MGEQRSKMSRYTYYTMQNNTRYENELWHVSNFSPFCMTAVNYFYLYGRSSLFSKWEGRKKRISGRMRVANTLPTSLIPSFGRRSRGNFRPRVFSSYIFYGTSGGTKIFRPCVHLELLLEFPRILNENWSKYSIITEYLSFPYLFTLR